MEFRPAHEWRAAWRAILLVFLSLAAVAQETQFFLRNGDRLTGTVLAESPSQVTLSNATLGKVSVPLAQIEKRIPVAPAGPATITNPPPAAPGPVAPMMSPALSRRLDDLAVAYVSGRISAAQFHRQRVALLAEASSGSQPVAGAKPPVVSRLTGEVQAGMDIGYATKDRQLYTGRLKVNHAHGRLRNAADYSFTYGRTDGELSANRMEGRLKTDYDLTRRLYAYNLGVAGYDAVRKLDSYFQIGPGAGHRLVVLTNFVLNVEAGANFQREIRADGTDTDVFYYRLAQESKFTLGPKLTLEEKLEYFPQWDDWSEYKLRFEANVKYWLNSRLFLNFSLIDIYDTLPASGVEPNDLQIRSTIGVKF